MIFKMYDCDFGVTLNGTNYDFLHVESVSIENPERTRLIRGANAKNTEGLSYREGLKEAKVVTATIIGMTAELHDLLKTAYTEQTRLDFYCISRGDGSSKSGKNGVLSQTPMQLNMDDSPESLNTQLVMEFFDIDEVHKS